MDEIYSSYQVIKINRKGRKQPRHLVLTYSHLQNFKDLRDPNPKRSIPLSRIDGVVFNSDNVTDFIVKVPSEYDYMFVSRDREKIIDDLRALICGDTEKQKRFFTWALNTKELSGCLKLKKSRGGENQSIPSTATTTLSLRPLSTADNSSISYLLDMGKVPNPKVETPLSRHPTRYTDIVSSNGTKYAAAVYIPSARPDSSWFRVNPYPSLITIEQLTWNSSSFTVYTRYCENGDLGHLLGLNHEGLPLDVVRLLAHDIAQALHYLHERNIIFRDLRPSKVVISSDYEAKLLHHGFSRVAVEPLDPEHSEYYSPRLDESLEADWWSFGILVHEMTVGTVPLLALEKPVPLKVLSRDFDPGNDQAKDLIERLLAPERNAFLRTQGGERVLATDFFSMSPEQRDEAKRSLHMLMTRQSLPAAVCVVSDDQFSVRSKRPG